jgi:hypothetical protein
MYLVAVGRNTVVRRILHARQLSGRFPAKIGHYRPGRAVLLFRIFAFILSVVLEDLTSSSVQSFDRDYLTEYLHIIMGVKWYGIR